MNADSSPGMTDLSGNWILEDEHGEFRLEVTLPGDMITALHKAGHIPDPYHGRNEYDLRWIAERDWMLSREFSVNDSHFVLSLSSVDTVADVSVNGQQVLACRNVFRSYQADLSVVLKPGNNTIAIHIQSSIRAGAELQARQPFRIPYHEDNNPIPNGNMLRKVQCDFGWDWNIALAPFGVYGDIQLLPVSQVRPGPLQVRQHHSNKSVEVELSVTVPGTAGVAFTFNGETQKGSFDTQSQTSSARFTVENPALWWPAGQGNQTLYPVSVTVGNSTYCYHVGLADIQLISEPDDTGRSFTVNVNGRDIFCKGANWIPADALAGRISQNKVRELLQSAVDANMNMIRVWGGGRYEPDWFYDICDELGLMVWQDFMFSCSLYPATRDFLAEVDAEVRENVARLQHHCSIALWCGDNELIGALTWFDESINNRDRYLVAYDRLNRTIENALLETDEQANWWPSSPSPGPLSFGDAWHDDSSGDMHFWSVWHEGKDFDEYRKVSPRFCSEFGFQSYPSLNVIRQFASPQDMNIASPVMESHQKNKGGNARIAETLFRYFRFPNGFENFVYLSQVQQGLAIKTAVTHWRSLKPHCMGTLFWQLNDTWPVCSWSSINHGGEWKLLHHMAQDFYQPILVSAIPDENTITLRVINDDPQSVQTSLNIFALGMDGQLRTLQSTELTVAPGTSVNGPVIPELAGQEVLYYTWTLPDGQKAADIYNPEPWKTCQLQDPEISLKINDKERDTVYTLTLHSLKPAFFVAIESATPGKFSDNAFTLLPGEPVTVTFTPRQTTAADRPEFIIRDLYSASYS